MLFLRIRAGGAFVERLGVVILWTWGLLTLFSVPVCRGIARQRGDSPGLFMLMALLLGPGAILLTRKATRRPELAQGIAVVALLGGLSTTLFVLSQTVFTRYADLFLGMSLALPVPTYTVLHLVQFARSGALATVWLLLNCIFPSLLYQFTIHVLRVDSQDEEELAAQLLRNWARLFPLVALISVFFSLLVFALWLPLSQLVGWIGG